jgi:hypothetical protein
MQRIVSSFRFRCRRMATMATERESADKGIDEEELFPWLYEINDETVAAVGQQQQQQQSDVDMQKVIEMQSQETFAGNESAHSDTRSVGYVNVVVGYRDKSTPIGFRIMVSDDERVLPLQSFVDAFHEAVGCHAHMIVQRENASAVVELNASKSSPSSQSSSFDAVVVPLAMLMHRQFHGKTYRLLNADPSFVI